MYVNTSTMISIREFLKENNAPYNIINSLEYSLQQNMRNSERKRLKRQKEHERFQAVLYQAIEELGYCTTTQIFYKAMEKLDYPSFPKVVAHLRLMFYNKDKYPDLKRKMQGDKKIYYLIKY